jgi:type II secretory pathway component PulK
MLQAKLDYALRTRTTSGNAAVATMRSFDPWLDVDSLYSGTVLVDSVRVDVRARDSGTQLNINTLTEDEFKTFFGYILNDYQKADQLAQSILDWRDLDDVPRVNGGERDDYVKAGLLALPANTLFRDVNDLLLVKGMTPAIFAAASPYLTTRAAATINLNSAPAPVLRVLPGMTDAILAQILNLRSQGRRITSVQQVMSAAQRGRVMTQAVAQANAAATQRLAARAAVETSQVALTFTVRSAPQAQPVRLLVVLQRSNVGNQQVAAVQFREW